MKEHKMSRLDRIEVGLDFLCHCIKQPNSYPGGTMKTGLDVILEKGEFRKTVVDDVVDKIKESLPDTEAQEKFEHIIKPDCEHEDNYCRSSEGAECNEPTIEDNADLHDMHDITRIPVPPACSGDEDNPLIDEYVEKIKSPEADVKRLLQDFSIKMTIEAIKKDRPEAPDFDKYVDPTPQTYRNDNEMPEPPEAGCEICRKTFILLEKDVKTCPYCRDDKPCEHEWTIKDWSFRKMICFKCGMEKPKSTPEPTDKPEPSKASGIDEVMGEFDEGGGLSSVNYIHKFLTKHWPTPPDYDRIVERIWHLEGRVFGRDNKVREMLQILKSELGDNK